MREFSTGYLTTIKYLCLVLADCVFRKKTGELIFATTEKMIDYAVTNGVNYFDTADAYGDSELVLGAALSKYPKESIKIATKIQPTRFMENR